MTTRTAPLTALPTVMLSEHPGGRAGESALVFGATGFIGRWLVKELLDSSVPVTAVVRGDCERDAPRLARRPQGRRMASPWRVPTSPATTSGGVVRRGQ